MPKEVDVPVQDDAGSTPQWYHDMRKRECSMAWSIFYVLKQLRWVEDWCAQSDSREFWIESNGRRYTVSVSEETASNV